MRSYSREVGLIMRQLASSMVMGGLSHGASGCVKETKREGYVEKHKKAPSKESKKES